MDCNFAAAEVNCPVEVATPRVISWTQTTLMSLFMSTSTAVDSQDFPGNPQISVYGSAPDQTTCRTCLLGKQCKL